MAQTTDLENPYLKKSETSIYLQRETHISAGSTSSCVNLWASCDISYWPGGKSFSLGFKVINQMLCFKIHVQATNILVVGSIKSFLQILIIPLYTMLAGSVVDSLLYEF